MPIKCAVLSCTSGYDNNKKKVSVFRFPKEDELKRKWLVAIGRKDYKSTKYSGICENHFKNDDVIHSCHGIHPLTGEPIQHPVRAKLKEGSIPCLKLTSVKLRFKPEFDKATTLKKRGHSSESDLSDREDDIPLNKLKKKYINRQADQDGSFDEQNDGTSDSDGQSTSKSSVKMDFSKLLSRYEQLKNKHLALGREIEILERVNISLKCKLFKVETK